MDRYAVFSYPHYYPSGGWYDFDKAFATSEEAVRYVEALRKKQKHGEGHWHVVDLETGERIDDDGPGYGG